MTTRVTVVTTMATEPLPDDAPIAPGLALAPSVHVIPAEGTTRAAVLVLHGGQDRSTEPVRPSQLAVLRLVPFQRSIARAARGDGVASWLLRYRHRGWNADGAGGGIDAVADVLWALDEIRRTHGDIPVVLIGHSMGGRSANRAAGHPSVVGVCALAPWLPESEPVEQLAGRSLVILHGDRDRWTSPAETLAFAVRARRVADRVARFVLPGSGHFMLRRPGWWHRTTRDISLGLLGVRPLPAYVADAFAASGEDGLRRPLR